MPTTLQSHGNTAALGQPAQPFEALDECHQQVIKTLDQMTALLDHLAEQGVDAHAQKVARSILTFFMGAAR